VRSLGSLFGGRFLPPIFTPLMCSFNSLLQKAGNPRADLIALGCKGVYFLPFYLFTFSSSVFLKVSLTFPSLPFTPFHSSLEGSILSTFSLGRPSKRPPYPFFSRKEALRHWFCFFFDEDDGRLFLVLILFLSFSSWISCLLKPTMRQKMGSLKPRCHARTIYIRNDIY